MVFLALSVTVVGCSTTATSFPVSSLTAATTSLSPTEPSESAAPSADVGAGTLEGLWATGAVPIADIKASMIAAGIKAADADAWIAEVGSPASYSFELEFIGTTFTHSEATPNVAMEVGESGTFTLSGTRLVLAIGESGNLDTYTMEATLSGDELSLQCIDSTEQGSAEDKAKHRRYTMAFYCSAVFRRQP
jgi:hypothetical protein